ncbi:MAG: CvpA family protein [Clostridia bacterium]|nr:CvpA family protein [Clostridia bacterium]
MAEHVISFVLDAVLVGLMAFVIIRHSIRGFLKSFISLIKTLLAPFLAIIFNLPLARLINGWFFAEPAKGWIKDWLLTTEQVTLENGVIAYKVHSFFDGIPKVVVDFILQSGEEDYSGRYMMSEHFTGVEQGVDPIPATLEDIESISDFLGNRLGLGISIVISFIVIFVVAEILFLILGKVLNKILQKATIIKRINILLGALVGVAVSLLIVWVVSFGIGKLFVFGAHYYEGVFKDSIIDNTLILKFFVKNDLWEFVKRIAIN